METNFIAQQIFLAAIESVIPNQLIRRNVHYVDGRLSIANHLFPIGKDGKIVVTGVGKATAKMAQELEKILGDRIAQTSSIIKSLMAG